jgi:hypothetical protein
MTTLTGMMSNNETDDEREEPLVYETDEKELGLGCPI